MAPPKPRSTIQRSSQPFFEQESTHRAVETLANAPGLTIFAGAGISGDRGSPQWDVLLTDLLSRLLLDDSDIEDRAATRAAAARFVGAYGPLNGASAVRQLLQDRGRRRSQQRLADILASEIEKTLYSPKWLPGGPLAQAIMRLAVTWASLDADIAIVTTNYDSNLEEFAGDDITREIAIANSVSIEAITSDTPPRDGRVIPIYHLHGYIPSDGDARGNLAFSEAGLEMGGELIKGSPHNLPLNWGTTVLGQRLRTSNTLFVGTTLRDPAVTRALVRVSPQAPTIGRKTRNTGRYGVFPKQADPWLADDSSTQSAANDVFAARLGHLDVTPVRPDFFGQVVQLLNEIVMCRTSEDAKRQYLGEAGREHRYGTRLRNWWTMWTSIGHHAHGEIACHDQCQVALAKAKEEVIEHITAAERARNAKSLVRAGELKLEIWLRRLPRRERNLVLWGTSEAARRGSAALHVAPIQNRSDYVAVETFCRGEMRTAELHHGSGRWQSYVSVPIILTDHPWYGLPVGVVNVMSARPYEKSPLRILKDEARALAEIRSVLEEVGTRVLDPSKFSALLQSAA